MQDLISRQAAIDALMAILDKPSHAEFLYTDEICGALNGLPSAQPEIVRCKDCGHWDTTWQNDFAPNYHYCSLVDGTRRDDFFCADAERRGEQDE